MHSFLPNSLQDYKCRFFQGPYPHFDAQFLWNQPPSITQAVTAEGFFETVGNFGPTEEQSFPGLRLINYVPLFIENDNLHGVTMYCRRGGIVGIEVSFEKVQQITGRAEGCSIHFPIRALDGEYISDVWVRVRNTSTQLRIGVEPAVVVSLLIMLECRLVKNVIRSGPLSIDTAHSAHIWSLKTKAIMTGNG